MSEIKDPKIKLFGKTIELPGTSTAADGGGATGDDSSNLQGLKSLPRPKQDEAIEEERTQPLTPEQIKDSNATPPTIDNSKPVPSASSESVSAKTSKTEELDQSDSQDKTLKKPDKILPCPRCNSMDTKFCYFNNYNVNQPRHFCKNCHRYWTAGGTMRNVPVGAGRRKNKHSIPQFRHLTLPEASTNGIHHTTLSPNGTILAFNSDGPLCESMASVLNIADKTIRNGSQKSHGIKENKDDHSSGSPTISSNDEVGKTGPNIHPLPPQVFPGAPWPYPFSAATFPVQLYSTPPPYWGCGVPGSWNIPWNVPQIIAPTSGPNSPTLGKHKLDHTEEENGLKENSHEKCLWVPKTLRIDDPGEAAKSSIWATLGINKHDDRGDCIGGGGLFKAFQREKSKGDEKSDHVPEASTVLQANPAALSRSLSFHERS